MVSGSKNNSRVKNKGKQKLVIAKDKKQLVTAVVVMAIFLINTVIMLVKGYQEEHPAIIATTPASQLPPNTLNSTPTTTDPTTGQPPTAGPVAVNSASTNPMPSPTQNPESTTAQDANKIYSQAVNLQGNPQIVKTTNSNPSGSDVEIIPQKTVKKKNEKFVSIIVDNTGRENPFLPSIGNSSANKLPKLLPYLTAPPENLAIDSQASKVMTTTISGILYDKYSPSAIINIEGADYLVKKGDVINHYKILSIQPTQVIVQLGKNIYHAGVGELLTQTNVNFNTIANLNKKFGGNEVTINVRKKNY